MSERGVVRADGSVKIHRALVSPDRFLVRDMDRMKLLIVMGEIMGATFFAIYLATLGPLHVNLGVVSLAGWQFALATWLINAIAGGIYLNYLSRMGRRGGYYLGVHARLVREQPSYRRSAHPSAPLKPVRDQQRF